MNRTLISAALALPMLLVSGAAFAEPLKPYSTSESGTIIIIATPEKCDATCVGLLKRAEQVAAKHPEVTFRSWSDGIRDSEVYVLTGNSGDTTDIAAREFYADSDLMSVYLEQQVDFVKRVQPLADARVKAHEAYYAARAPFDREYEQVKADQQAALAPVTAKWNGPIAKDQADAKDLKARIHKALGDLAHLYWGDMTSEEQTDAQNRINAIRARFQPEIDALEKRQFETLKAAQLEIIAVDKPFEDKLADIEKRRYEATKAESAAMEAADDAIRAADLANQKATNPQNH